jgi:aminodeoxyfutalosine deaminase
MVTDPANENGGLSGRSSSFIRSLPKAELHLHLEGAVDPAMLAELAAMRGQELDPAMARAWYDYSDFTGFLLCFRAITKYLETPEDYELITYRLMQRLARENVRHAEVYVSVGACFAWERNFDEIFIGMERGRARGERDFGVSLYWIFDAVRHFGAEKAMCVAESAVQKKDYESVIGFGIGGDERRASPELFADVCSYAASNGLRLTCHAGETAGPESVWGALRTLKTERIGHGLTCWQDPGLMSYLADKHIPLEISVTSNFRTNCIAALADHPVRKYYDAGLLITLNTDDPGLFETTLCGEYEIAQNVFGFTDDQLRELAKNSFKASFLPEEKKRGYLKLFDAVPAATNL